MAKKTAPATPAAPTILPAGFFAFRTPLLPFSTLTEWAAELRAPGAAESDLEAALADDRKKLRERLFALAARPEVREALFVASPSLDESLAVWLAEPESERGQKVERTVVRYLARMAGRPTPFGLFAGCSVGTLGAATRLAVEGRTKYGRHTRLDGDYLSALTEALGRDAALRRSAIYRPNSSLYRAAGRLRYAEARLDGKVRSYHLVAVEPTDYLEATLARAREGAALDTLAEALVDDEITREEADEFVGQLVDSQLLVSDLQPQVTGPEPIHDLIDQLAQKDATRAVSEKLAGARKALADLDASPLGASPDVYRAIATGLDGLPAEVELSRLFQVDMVKPSPEAALGPEAVNEIVRGAELLRKMSARPRETGLTRFREAFTQRYEGREVPLVEVLDEEAGIGFEKSNAPTAEASPLLEGLAFGGGGDGDGEEQVGWGPRIALLFRKLEAAVQSGAREIVLDKDDLQKLERKTPPPIAESIAAMATLAAPSEEAFAAGDFLVWIHSVGGPSGANLLGRFCHGDEQLTKFVLQHLRDEEAQQPDAVFAEVAHLPEGRIGNVLLRPLLRAHEIPYLGRSGAPGEQQIPVDDLMVSVRGSRVVLRSRRLGREVIPRLTTAHNFSNPRNLGVYRFLCALQYQELGSLGFSWGALESAAFLPRVRVGKLVLSLARWRIDGDPLKKIGEAKGAKRYALVQELRRANNLPRFIAVADGDNVLPIDLDNTLSIETFAQLVKERPSLTLTEVFEPEKLCARGPEGAFVHEVVVPLLVKRPEAAQPRARLQAPPTGNVPRLCAPGSDWLYVKLYTGAATADQVLRDGIAPLVRDALASGAADSWFFIRYGDPDWHVRVRFRGEPARLRSEVMPPLEAAIAAAVEAQQVWKVQFDSYEREIDRYGGDEGILLAEDLFRADSDACLAIVETLSGDEGADARWRLAVRGMDMLLDDLGLDFDGKRAVMRNCRQGFAAEFRAEGLLDKQLGDKFRKERIALEQLLDPKNDAGSMFEPGFDVLKQRSERVRQIAAVLREREAGNLLNQPISSLAPSFLHMHANRMLRAAARAQELVIYDFLDRLYEGRAARAKKQAKAEPPPPSEASG